MNISCIVDVASREVSFQENYKIASYDHNVDVIHFSVEPIEDFSLDLSSIRIAAQGPNNVRHDYAVDPSTVSIEEETGYITFDWPIPQGVTEMPIGSGFKYGDKGKLIFSVCAEIISGSTLSKAWHSDDGIITVVAHLEPESGGGEDPSETATNAQKIAQLQTTTAILQREVSGIASGTPPTASTIAEMDAETSTVYIYTGLETGYTAGNWYFWNGSAWTSGGTYGGVPTDTTLTQQGRAADAKAVGDALALKADDADITALDTRVTVVEDDIDDINDRLNTIATGDPINVYPVFHLGYVHGVPSFTPQEPAHNSSNDFVCTTDYISVADAKKLYFDSTNYQICVVYYNASKVYQTFVSPTTTPNPYVLDTQYAYCVVELRKSDRSAFSEIDIANANGTVYYIEEIEADIVRHAELSNAVSGIETEISGLATKKKIQPDFFPTLPYDVYRTISGYTCETPLDDLTGDWVTVYCDSANGNDENDGTLGHPVKTLTQADLYARRQMANNNKQVIIQIADNSVFYIDDIPASNDASKSLIMRADTKATIFAGKKPIFTVSSSHYVSEALTDYTIIGCVDTSETDDYGLFKPMVAVSSESDVDATENSYYIDSTNKIVYVHPKTSIDDIVVIFSNKYAVNPAGRKFATSSFFYYENLIFVGNSTATGRLTDTVGETVQRSLFFKNCVFQHGFSNNCVSFNDWESAYIIGCTAGYAKFDCFNYHYTRKPTPTDAIAVEIDCRAKEAGYYNNTSGYSDNLTTCHEGANILRCGSHGYNGNGGMCADVNGCYTACLDCTYVNTSYADTLGRNRPAFFFNDDLGTRNGKTLLQNCYGYDSRNNKMVSAVDLTLNGVNAGGTIEASTIKVGKELI